MTAKELLNLTANDLVNKISSSIGLNQFIIERAKFEGWLKVELIDTLLKMIFWRYQRLIELTFHSKILLLN